MNEFIRHDQMNESRTKIDSTIFIPAKQVPEGIVNVCHASLIFNLVFYLDRTTTYSLDQRHPNMIQSRFSRVRTPTHPGTHTVWLNVHLLHLPR